MNCSQFLQIQFKLQPHYSAVSAKKKKKTASNSKHGNIDTKYPVKIKTKQGHSELRAYARTHALITHKHPHTQHTALSHTLIYSCKLDTEIRM